MASDTITLEEAKNEPDVPNRTLGGTDQPTPWLGIPFDGVVGCNHWHVGLDLTISGRKLVFPDSGYPLIYGNHGGYNLPTSGLFVPDFGPDMNSQCRFLATKISRIALEFYSDDPGSGGSGPQLIGAGGVRIVVDEFTHEANGGIYSPPLGIVPMGKPSPEARVQGWVWENGSKVDRKDVIQVEAFHESSEAARTILTSGSLTSYVARPFFSVRNNSDGYFYYSPAPVGLWHVYVTNRISGDSFEFSGPNKLLAQQDHPWNFHLDKPRFGH